MGGRKKRIRPLLPGTTVELTWQKLLLAYEAHGSINTYTHTHTHTHTHILSLPTRQYELLYSLKGHLTEYQQRLAETRSNITTRCKRINLSLSTFQRELRTLSVTLIPLYIITMGLRSCYYLFVVKVVGELLGSIGMILSFVSDSFFLLLSLSVGSYKWIKDERKETKIPFLLIFYFVV